MSKPIRIYVKNFVAGFLYWSGYLKFYKWLQRFNQPACRILCYHSINSPPTSFFTLADRLMVSPKQFREQLEYMKRNYYFLSENEFVSQLHSPGGFQKDAVLITLDDGFHDNLDSALPLLNSFQVPAIIFITGKSDDKLELRWWHDLAMVINDCSKSNNGKSGKLSPGNSYWKEYYELLEMPQKKRKSIMNEKIKCLNGKTEKRLKFLEEEDIQQMQKHNISFGGHTVNHVDLGKVDKETAQNEIIGSVEFVHNSTNRQVQGFAYPFGKKQNYTDTVVDILRKTEVKYAVTTEWGVITNESDPYRLKRFIIDGTDSIYAFMCKIEGIFKT